MAKPSIPHPLSPILCPPCFFLAGPTAVGKSEIAFLLAEKIGGEIISVDSMQVYRGLDTGTAKPSAEERARVRHHLIDVMDLRESFDAAKFVELANVAVTEIQSRGHVPIFAEAPGFTSRLIWKGSVMRPRRMKNCARNWKRFHWRIYCLSWPSAIRLLTKKSIAKILGG